MSTLNTGKQAVSKTEVTAIMIFQVFAGDMRVGTLLVYRECKRNVFYSCADKIGGCICNSGVAELGARVERVAQYKKLRLVRVS